MAKSLAPPINPKAIPKSPREKVEDVIQQMLMRQGNSPEDSRNQSRQLIGKPNVRSAVDDFDSSMKSELQPQTGLTLLVISL